MRAVSLFSGCGGFDLGLERAGIETVLQCDLFDASHMTDIDDEERRELTRYGQALAGVLERHWPGVERVNDVRNVGARRAEHDSRRGRSGDAPRPDRAREHGLDGVPRIDLVHFGSPCQDLSVAGKQSGFVEGGRSHLFFEGVRVIREFRPRFALWENVAGALSSNGGRDFAAVLAALADAGAVDIAWRVLDARWFGVPQRRRRVFVVADFGGERAAEVLFEPEGGGGAAQARGAAGEGVAFALTASVRGTGDGHGNIWNSNYVANPLGAHHGRGDLDNDSYVVAPIEDIGRKMSGGPEVGSGVGEVGDPMFTLGAGSRHGVAMAIRTAQTGSNGWGVGTDEQAYTLDGAQGQAVLAGTVSPTFGSKNATNVQEASNGALWSTGAGVRRLTPRECERLMGWPDDWTRWTADGREVSDSLRYRMCGNGVVAPVAEWIGHRLVAVDALNP